jgi:mRNA interferase MazF
MTVSDYKFDDILLLKFPFTDLTGFKKRPALVLLDNNDNDILVCRITSQAKDSYYDMELQDWHSSGLKLSSIVRLHKIATLNISLIERKMGSLSNSDLNQVKTVIGKSFTLINQ